MSRNSAVKRAKTGRRSRRPSRRGVASVLAMMFVVLFGSLAVAMAIASKGNLRTAQTHLHVVRAMGAAETGMAVAQQRLLEAASRFSVEKGTVDTDFGWRLWVGSVSASDGNLVVLPPALGYSEASLPRGIADALVNIHAADLNTVGVSGVPTSPLVHNAPGDADLVRHRATHWVTTPPIAVDDTPQTPGSGPAAFQITYAPLASGNEVRVIVTGYSIVTSDGAGYQFGPGGSRADAEMTGRPLTRVIEQTFRITKRHTHAILSPARIMIGKNVSVYGNLGGQYTDVAQTNGHPITIKSDFFNLDPILDQKLRDFYQGVAQYDVDGDNRLRVRHPIESQGIPAARDYSGDGEIEDAFADATGDGYVDDFDIFINHFDRDGDKRVVLSAALTQGTPAEGLTPEFTLDDDLALLIDSAVPDRNNNGVHGYEDLNSNGRWDPGEPLLDFDQRTNTHPDRVLGWRDGVIDRRDQYAKVHGRLMFRVAEPSWRAAHGSPSQFLNGPIVPAKGEAPLQFIAPERDLPTVTRSTFTRTQTPLTQAANGQPFANQVAAQLGISVPQLATYTEAKPSEPPQPRYWRGDLDSNYVYQQTGRHLYEKMPFGSPAFFDWYVRPRYENMVFRNVQIPEGTNALFVNCTFIGVTFVRSAPDNTHPNWSLYGRLAWNNGTGRPMPVTQPLDKSDFLRYVTGNVADGPANYTSFPDPPTIHGIVRTGDARNTKLYTNNLRFHDCLFVGSIVSDTPTEYTHVRNKIQFTGSTRFALRHPEPSYANDPNMNPDPAHMEEIVKSSMLLPNYSVDLGSFNSPTDTFPNGPRAQNVRLQGTIVAGLLDIRGTASIDGSLILTFAPTAGQGPLQQNGTPIGNPANFNATIGYFGPEDGDGESMDPTTLPIVNGQRIVGWDTDGDGLADVDPTQPQPAGSAAVPFYGFGRVTLRWNPDAPMPDGILMPVTVVPIAETYREGRQ